MNLLDTVRSLFSHFGRTPNKRECPNSLFQGQS